MENKFVFVTVIVVAAVLFLFGCTSSSSYGSICGNGVCETGENVSNCPVASGGDCSASPSVEPNFQMGKCYCANDYNTTKTIDGGAITLMGYCCSGGGASECAKCVGNSVATPTCAGDNLGNMLLTPCPIGSTCTETIIRPDTPDGKLGRIVVSCVRNETDES